MQPEKHKKVEQIVIVVVDNVIQDKSEEEDQHTDKSYSQGVAQFPQTRFAEDFVVATGKGMEENPVKGPANKPDVEFVVVQDGDLEIVKDGLVNDVLPKNEEYAPCQKCSDNVEEEIEEDDLFFVRHDGDYW